MFRNQGVMQAGKRINMSAMGSVENLAPGVIRAKEGIDLLGLTLDAGKPCSPRTRQFLEAKGAVLSFSAEGVALSGNFTLTNTSLIPNFNKKEKDLL